MKKAVWLSLGTLILVGSVFFAIWYIGEKKEMKAANKEAFIPYSSSVVLCVNSKPHLAPNLSDVIDKELEQYRKKLLMRMADSLQGSGHVIEYPYVLALRVQGGDEVASLYIMEHNQVLSKGDIVDFLNMALKLEVGKERKYEGYKIYTLKQQKEMAYLAICGNFVLLSDSDLYIEDALKQFREEEGGKLKTSQYQQLNKYFSLGAGINLFLNTSAFTDLLPLFLQAEQVFPYLNVQRLFKWGALDGELSEEGVSMNGFLSGAGLHDSYIQTLIGQQSGDSDIDDVVPAQAAALGMLKLSDVSSYFVSLDSYRHALGQKNKLNERKLQVAKIFGKQHEQKLRELLQGEFAVVEMEYKSGLNEMEGLVIAKLKSGSMGRQLLDEMMQNCANAANRETTDFIRHFRIDQQKSYPYYQLQTVDMPFLYWGDVFQGVKSRYVFVEDNYWIFASSEETVRHFIRDYVHGSSVCSMDWYKKLKMKLAGKDNFSYFAKSAELLPQYKETTMSVARQWIENRLATTSLFPTWAWQWSNEGKLVYSTIFLNSEPLKDEERPHVDWQTRLGAAVSMKPVSVINHVTGERELFVQDEQNTIYLINDAGRILWQQLVDGKINSEVYQVDLFKNGKLQFLFSTPSKMYLIDRNGNAVNKFPVTFRAHCEQGITLCDYEQNKNYRVFAPCVDKQIYLYGLDAQLVKGWEPKKTDNPIVSRVQHVRISDKDYIVFADQYRVYILDRKGKERVKVSTVFDLPEQTAIYLAKQSGKLIFAGKQGVVYGVDFSGKVTQFKVEGILDSAHMNVADVNGDGKEECVMTEKNKLFVVQPDGKLLSTYTLDVEEMGYPYIYQFSQTDYRIGLTDRKRSQMLLLSPDGKMSKGFPIPGDSPFSIVFSGKGGFILFAGAEKGSLFKYRVQR